MAIFGPALKPEPLSQGGGGHKLPNLGIGSYEHTIHFVFNK